jgi:site-specific recombinase XerC
MGTAGNVVHRKPWNKGKLVGQKAPFKLKDIWALLVRLQMEGRVRELALFNLGIDSKLRGCDLVGLKVRNVCHGDQVAARAIVVQHKTQRPVQFEITPAARDAVQAWIRSKTGSGGHPRRADAHRGGAAEHSREQLHRFLNEKNPTPGVTREVRF